MPKKNAEESKTMKEEEDKVDKELEDEEDEEEDEEEEKKKKSKKKKEMVKGEGTNPEEDTSSATDANSTISPGNPASTQDVFVPSSSVSTGREANHAAATGEAPSEVSYGKSAEPDLLKSPLYLEISKGLSSLQESMSKKLEAVEKSVNDRVANLQKALGEVEKFYKSPMYKAVSENSGAEALKKESSVAEQIAKGQVRFSN